MVDIVGGSTYSVYDPLGSLYAVSNTIYTVGATVTMNSSDVHVFEWGNADCPMPTPDNALTCTPDSIAGVDTSCTTNALYGFISYSPQIYVQPTFEFGNTVPVR